MPSTDYSAILKTFVDLIREPWKIVVTIFLVAGAALFIAPFLAAKIGIEAPLHSYHFALWGWFAFSAVYLVITAAHEAWKRLNLWTYLHDLPSDERNVILSFMNSGRRTASLISNAGAASAMADMGILKEAPLANPNNYKVGRGEFSYSIKPWIFRFFEKRPHLYSEKKP